MTGIGDTDNTAFVIVNDQLQLATSLDFETKSSYSIRVQAVDAGGLSIEKILTIHVSNVNEAPTGIQLSNATINEHSPNGTLIGTFTTIDPDQGDTYIYQLLDDAGGRFSIQANRLIVTNSALLDFEQNRVYSIIVRTQDAGGSGFTYDQAFSITVNNVIESDLTVQIKAIPTTANFGEPFDVTWIVRNTGTDPTTNLWSDRLYLSTDSTLSQDDTILLTQSASQTPLAPNGEYSQTATVTLPLNDSSIAGRYYILAQTDTFNSQPETNETNNLDEQAIYFDLAPYADLQVSQVTAPQLTVGNPAEVTIGWQVANVGKGAGTVTSWVDRVFVSGNAIAGDGDDILIGDFIHTGLLDVGQFYNQNQTVLLPPRFQGNYHLFVQTDATGLVFENGLKANNQAFAPNFFDVVPVPYADLAAKVWTLGAISHNGKLARNQSYEGEQIFNLNSAATGQYVIVETGGAWEGIYQENSSQAIATNVTASPADLRVTNITVPNSTNFSGETTTIQWTVENQGSPIWSGTRYWTDLVYLLPDPRLTVQNYNPGDQTLGGVKALGSFSHPAANSYTQTQQITLPAGIDGKQYIYINNR
ncbi:hypothetical protein NIES2100_63280 [Calothrix sp. NIES-2100]|nr:hypothetical protein NIES2100_63280 [Calothrix sp. NIES-2100]